MQTRISQVNTWPVMYPSQKQYEPAHENMALFNLRKLILQTRMCNHPVEVDAQVFVGPFIYFHSSCVRTAKEGSGETAQMRRLASASAGRLCDKYHNLMSWLI